MAYYTRDPRWITSRFTSKCSAKGCDQYVKKGDKAYYYPNTKSVLCQDCGERADADFQAAANDEAAYNVR